MYNDPTAINELTQRIIKEMGWPELNSRRAGEQYIQNAVGSELRPGDKEGQLPPPKRTGACRDGNI